jgi:hypothetical protein
VETGKSPASRAALILKGVVLTMIRQEKSSRGDEGACLHFPTHPKPQLNKRHRTSDN